MSTKHKVLTIPALASFCLQSNTPWTEVFKMFKKPRKKRDDFDVLPEDLVYLGVFEAEHYWLSIPPDYVSPYHLMSGDDIPNPQWEN